MPNYEQITGFLRTTLPAVLGYLAGAHLIPAGDYQGLVAAGLTFAAALWSLYSNRSGTVNGSAVK